MLDELKHEANYTLTENSALTHKSTLSHCLDLFAAIGALRNTNHIMVCHRFKLAFAEDPDMAVRIAFYARDIRGGLGERETFRTILSWLAIHSPATVAKNIALIPEYGRWDDFIALIGTPCESMAECLIRDQLRKDKESDSPSLLAKWLPSVNASSKITRARACRLAGRLHMSLKDYRQTLSALREKLRIIENNLREKDYTFDYSKQPSRAMLKYRQAFIRNDNERYNLYLQDVAEGRAEIHTGTLAPYDIVMPIFTRGMMTDDERKALNTTWDAQEDFTNGENALVVADGSGSMYGGNVVYPVAVAMSLAIYFA
ncbi:MAG: DUF2828 family protein, partial [Synergistaceae bacterium]|nr:DUF2828 family protein [Synergistaceae bacterium]